MSLRVNHNMSAINAHRNVVNNANAQAKTLEKLSSGLKINRAADSPAQLQISENLRAQTAGLSQAIDNSEMAVSLLQTAEGALDEVSRALVQARQLAVHAGNEGVNDPNMLQADQSEFENVLEQINRIATSTQYGHNYLLDGSRAGNGVTTGDNLEFIDAGVKANSSGAGGYTVNIQQAATRSIHSGTVALTQGIIDSGEQITVSEGGKTVNLLTEKGKSEAEYAGKLIKELNIEFDAYFTSIQKRAINTLKIILDTLQKKNSEIKKAWELNERHYGALTGYNKDEIIKKYGSKQVQIWRRSFNISPPPMDSQHPYKKNIYINIPKDKIPASESLKDTFQRVVPYYEKKVEPLISLKKNVLITAHGNSLRALCKKLFNISKKKIINFEIPTGNPLLIRFEDNLKVKDFKYLDTQRAKKIIFNV